MFVGHFAEAFAAKRVEPQISLGTLVMAAILSDILWPIFTVAGLEYTAKSSSITNTPFLLDEPLSFVENMSRRLKPVRVSK